LNPKDFYILFYFLVLKFFFDFKATSKKIFSKNPSNPKLSSKNEIGLRGKIYEGV